MKTLTTVPKPEFPHHVDATMLGSFRACEAKYMINYFLGYVPEARSIHLHAGGTYAKGLEVARLALWHKNLPLQEALYYARIAMIKEWGEYEAPEGQNKNLPNLLLAVEEYFRHYGVKTDAIQPLILPNKKPAVEFSFAIPIPGTRHPDTGDPILYTGRFDMLGVYQNALYAVDEKTTVRLGPSWNRQWLLRSQFSGYCWAARQYGYPVAGAVIRGLSILTRDFGHSQVITHRPPCMVDAWLETTKHTIKRMIQAYQSDEWYQDFDAACSAYTGCPYMDLCDKQDPNRWVDKLYIVDRWDPLAGEKG